MGKIIIDDRRKMTRRTQQAAVYYGATEAYGPSYVGVNQGHIIGVPNVVVPVDSADDAKFTDLHPEIKDVYLNPDQDAVNEANGVEVDDNALAAAAAEPVHVNPLGTIGDPPDEDDLVPLVEKES